MKPYLLHLLSAILKPIFSLIGNIYGLIYNKQGIKEKEYKKAQSNDRYVNVACAELFNRYLIEEDSPYKFGDGRETISSVLGRNEQIGKLKDNKTWWKSGVWWDKYLNKVDPGHTKKAIGWRPVK
jgi:hypothetical protein